jgi:hypothetical protein
VNPAKITSHAFGAGKPHTVWAKSRLLGPFAAAAPFIIANSKNATDADNIHSD